MESYINLIYPSNLDKINSNFIMMIGQEWGTEYREDMTAEYQALNNYISVALPMTTAGLTDSTSHSWEATEGALLNLTTGNIGKMAMKGLLDSAKAAFGNMANAQQYKAGLTINDFAAMTYGGHDFRKFEFDFELIPNNATDAKIIKDVIHALKFGSLPKNLGPTRKYPYFWTVQAVNPKGDKYFSMEKCVINNLSIRKFTGDAATIHSDGEPIQTNISISFTELYKEWSDDYKPS